MSKRTPSTRQADRSDGPHVIHPTGVYFVDDLTRVLRVKADTIRTAIRSGALRRSRRGGRYIFLGQWLLDWIEAGQ